MIRNRYPLSVDNNNNNNTNNNHYYLLLLFINLYALTPTFYGLSFLGMVYKPSYLVARFVFVDFNKIVLKLSLKNLLLFLYNYYIIIIIFMLLL